MTITEKAAAYDLIEIKANVLKKVYTEFIEKKKEEVKSHKEKGYADYVIAVEESLIVDYTAKLEVINELI